MPKKQLKIAFINIYHDAQIRGAEVFINELSKRLSKKHIIEIFSGKQKLKLRLPLIWRMYLDPFGLQTFFGTLKILINIWKVKYDIVVPINGGWQPILIRIVTRLYGGKMVISGQSGIGWDDRINLWCFPDTFVAPSSKALLWAKRINGMVRSNYIPNGVDTALFKASYGGDKISRRNNVIAVGAFVKQKRLNLVIKAVSKLNDVKLFIVGSVGEQKEYLEKLGLKLLGKDRFEIKSVPYSKMSEIYNQGGVFTLPSETSEAFGNVLLEAMASGLPVVATDDPIRREIVGDAGLYIDPTNTEEYAAALEKALNTEWGNKPRLQAENFSWDKIADQYEKLFFKLAS